MKTHVRSAWGVEGVQSVGEVQCVGACRPLFFLITQTGFWYCHPSRCSQCERSYCLTDNWKIMNQSKEKKKHVRSALSV